MRKAAAAKYVGITQDALDFHLLMGNVVSRVEKDRFGESQVFEKSALDALKRLIEERRYIQVEIDRLEGNLKSLDEGVRAKAIRSLLRLGDPLILPPLLRELFGVRAHKLLFVEAEETLVRMGAPAAIMLSRWRDGDGERGDLARAVLDRISPESVGDKIARRAAKLAGLGVTANPDWCVLKLLEIPDPRIIAPLFDSFDDRWGNDLAFMAEDAFARLGEQAVGPLLAALGHPHPRARALAAAALGRIGDARALGPLLSALADEEELVRASAAAALAYFSEPRVTEALLASLRDPAPSVRAAAASALWRAHDADVRAALETATQDPDAFVRQSAAYALKNPGRGPLEIEPLLEGLLAEGQDVRWQAVQALARTLDPRARGRLRCACNFGDTDREYTLVEVLRAFNEPRADGLYELIKMREDRMYGTSEE